MRFVRLANPSGTILPACRWTRSHFLEQTGVPALWGEKGYTPAERVGARPTLEINGMLSGFTGTGFRDRAPGPGDGENLLPPGARPEPAKNP